MTIERIDKILARQGYGSRKDVKKLLHSGQVTVNGETCTQQDAKVDIDKDRISVGNEKLTIKTNVYIMMNKPQNVICSTRDDYRSTVFEILSDDYHHIFLGGELHCVGRLDTDTEGLLLLTTDGQFTHKLISPKNKVSKIYSVTLRDNVNDQQKEQYRQVFEAGMEIPPEDNNPGFTAQSAKVDFTSDNTCTLEIYEGKYHQVKRMFKVLGNEVTFLKRTRIGPVELDENLSPGSYRELTEKELSAIFSL